ncbi:MAG: pyridoxamine 5'-phosphate oxidase family protein [Cytophagaceae bacterium]|nr:pyridoxamine 5'-phosphate oxidase family protein [Gemmatimonadaceae bacterium]
MTTQPQVRELTRPEIDAFLAARTHGRIAYSFHDRVDIEPIHYVYEAGWLYGRTQPGLKLSVLQRNPWVAFEVDEVRGTFDWTSVVVKGTVYFVDDAATDRSEEIHQRVLERLRTLIPEALTPDDPVPERRVLFRLLVDDARGRSFAPDPG